MNFREMILRTFQRKKTDRIVWQPRIRYWYNGNQVSKRPDEIRQDELPYPKVPHEYRGKTVLQVYDHLRASPRYPGEVLDIGVFRTKTHPEAQIKHTAFDEAGERVTITETPVGKLKTRNRGGYPTEYALKTPDDCEIMKYVLQHTEFQFDAEAYERAEKAFGERGIVQSFYSRSPFQRMIVEFMGARNFFIQLHRHQGEMESFMDAIAEWDDGMYEVLVKCPMKILNFGENIDANLASPKFFRKYLIPYYERRVKQLHRVGKFCHIHMDGAMKPLLPLLDELEFDGIEAATPKPQGDVEIDELKEGMGDKILLDGIPAVMFIPVYTEKQVRDFAMKVLETFSPNLILGVSDELPPTADIRLMELVSRLVEDFQP